MTITPEELRILCDTTVRLVELRIQANSYLSVETVAPGIMDSLLASVMRAKEDSDTARLDWLMYHISGVETRRLGILFGSGCTRAAVDSAMAKCT